VEARREKRTYEILSERAKMRKADTASRRKQAEIDELLQRAVKTS
jgi:flagellar biosynthesis chaperone FliJ